MLRTIPLLALFACLSALDVDFQPGEAAIHVEDAAGFTVVIPRFHDVRGDLVLERRTAHGQESFHIAYVAAGGDRQAEYRDQVYAAAGPITAHSDTIQGVPTRGLSQVVAIPNRKAYITILYTAINDNSPVPKAFPNGFNLRVQSKQ